MSFAGLGMAKNYGKARSYFQNSAQGGNLVAFYNLGIIQANGFGLRASCPTAVTLYRKVLERSVLKTSTMHAYRLYSNGYFDRALIHYELAADQGDVLAQMNVAWLYEMGIGVATLGGPESGVDKREREKRALEFYLRAAQQGSADAHLKVGDYYWYGWAMNASNPEMAAGYYRVASDSRNAQAAFNLGYMHHRGIGLPKDPHLAKRYYDLATELNPEANLPSLLALASLSAEQFLEHLQAGGLVFGFQWDTLAIVALTVFLVIAVLVRHVVIG